MISWLDFMVDILEEFLKMIQQHKIKCFMHLINYTLIKLFNSLIMKVHDVRLY
jgi:hypothetical protein